MKATTESRERGESVRRRLKTARAWLPTAGLLLATTALVAAGNATRDTPWGASGHGMAARVATERLPDAMPAFFRDAADQLVYLNPEPDRWREWEQREMDQAFAYDHYVDLENLPAGALDAPDRFAYLRLLYEAGLERPERDAGFLPFRIVELYQRLTSAWRRWREEQDPHRRGWLEERIVADAGVLGHYVTDASQPHHTTIHFNGWDADTPNPQGYTRQDDFHARFERHFVDAHVTLAMVRSRTNRQRLQSVAGSARDAVADHVMAAHAEVETLYMIERDDGFAPDRPASERATDFAAQRLAAGAEMLAVLWWSAWLESAQPDGP